MDIVKLQMEESLPFFEFVKKYDNTLQDHLAECGYLYESYDEFLMEQYNEYLTCWEILL